MMKPAKQFLLSKGQMPGSPKDRNPFCNNYFTVNELSREWDTIVGLVIVLVKPTECIVTGAELSEHFPEQTQSLLGKNIILEFVWNS